MATAMEKAEAAAAEKIKKVRKTANELRAAGKTKRPVRWGVAAMLAFADAYVPEVTVGGIEIHPSYVAAGASMFLPKSPESEAIQEAAEVVAVYEATKAAIDAWLA